jgi:hypothetical protein
MIIYRDQRSQADPRQLLTQLRARVGRLAHLGRGSHDLAVDILIELGTLESGLGDALFPEADGINSLARGLRTASIAAGHILWHSWHDSGEGTGAWAAALGRMVDQLMSCNLPPSIQISVPEGYAYYGVYPEMYLKAATEYSNGLDPGSVVCLGLRSIGVSLSAAVAAALEELGWTVESWTLRPRGHPFARNPELSPELTQLLRARRTASFLIVDEGPGISGSSFAGTAVALQRLGVPDHQIILFPSWRTDGARLRSSVARESWPRYRQVSVPFESAWLQSGRLGRIFRGELYDISAGNWRRLLYSSSDYYPAVQPQHEQRKYLAFPSAGEPARVIRFAGLGERGREKMLRAARLAAVGFSAKPLELAAGFIAVPFTPGRPTLRGETPRELLECAARYLAYLVAEHPREPSVGEASLREMIDVNLIEGVGERRHKRLETMLPQRWTERPVELDARMQPHEWVQTVTGFLKCDAIDHHDDHFLPGCQDIAWDVAGATLEFGLNAQERRFFLDRYRRLSHDTSISLRLPHYAIAYLAFRLGYATLASEVLGEAADDGRRFQQEAARYRYLLLEESGVTSAGFWDG